MENFLLSATFSSIQWLWVSDSLRKHILGGLQEPRGTLAVVGTRMRFSDLLSDYVMVRWALSFFRCLTMAPWNWRDSAILQAWIQSSASGASRIIASTCTTLHCPEADWCPNPTLGGDPPGDHPSSYRDAQMFWGVTLSVVSECRVDSFIWFPLIISTLLFYYQSRL